MELNQQRMAGACGEEIVAAEFLKRGVPVYRPLVDVGADLVVDIGGKLQRVQVKSSVDAGRRVLVHFGRRNSRRDGHEKCWLQYDTEPDWYAVCCISHNYTALLHASTASVRFTFDRKIRDDRLDQMEIGVVIDRLLEENK